MSDYTRVYDKSSGDTIDESEFESEFDLIQTAVATKYDSDDLLDEDDMASDSAVKFPTQQSTKAYVDGRTSLETPVTFSGGSTQDFTGIGSGAKRITMMISDVDITVGTSPNFYILLGDSGGMETSGYDYISSYLDTSTLLVQDAQNSTNAFLAISLSSTAAYHGVITMTLLDSSTNTWNFHSNIGRDSGTEMWITVGSKSLSGVLTQVRFGMGGTTPAIDSGKINILIEY